MDTERKGWLVRLIDATARAAEHVAATGDPQQRGLLTDLLKLHARLVAELDAGKREA